MEKWLPSREFSNYDVSDEGNVRNRKTGRVMKTNVNKKGYRTVSLREDGKYYTRKVANLVADAFIEEERNGRDVTYKDGDRSNIYADNLEYKTRSEISKRAFERGTRVANNCVKIRDIETGEIYESVSKCSKVTGINRPSISRSAGGCRINIHDGRHFEIVDQNV